MENLQITVKELVNKAEAIIEELLCKKIAAQEDYLKLEKNYYKDCSKLQNEHLAAKNKDQQKSKQFVEGKYK
jgi:hypothetical protein